MSTERHVVRASAAPAALGPYSQAISHAGLLYCSGQLPIDPSSGAIEDGPAALQARRCLENLEAVCVAAGTSLSRAVRVGVYMVELEFFAELNAVFEEFFATQPPARVTIGVAALPRGAGIEIDAIVAL